MPLRSPQRWRTKLFLLCLVAAASVSIAPGTASAGCCYGAATWNPGGTYTGGLSTLNASALSLSGGSAFVVATLWVLSSSSEFVEQGIGRDPVNGLHWYWAEAADCVPYQQHITGLSTSLGIAYNSKISYNSGGKWAVYRNGSFVANSSTCHGSTTYNMATGLEASSSGDTGSGTASNLQKRGSDGSTWSYNWGGATLLQRNASASWITQYASLNWSKP